ncbi:hypothetical protein CEP54_004941 [Fusarium duplospermum]|uniref:Uncharacterized protein n=1 Tax=Fusarium duplospermum TaxID=1325734 RepID=A0A428QEY0_9HYPO|nr:hypothetical protein CEP54_004941 [Fusarium duplospermum]
MTMTSGGQAPSITVTGQRHEATRRHWRERGEKSWSAWNGHLPEEFQVGSPSHRPIMSGLELSRLKTALRVRLESSVVRITAQTMASTDHYVPSYQLRQDFAQVQLGAWAALHMALQPECRFGDGFSVLLLSPKFSRVHPQTGSKPLVAPHAWKAKRMKQVDF